MSINWKVRFKNPVFWGNIIVAIILPMLTYFGICWEDITTWSALGQLFIDAVSNPVVVVSVTVSIWNAVNDPTTKGLSDSVNALTYKKPN